MKPNWAHVCVSKDACCQLLIVIGKIDIYYAKAIKCYLLRRSDIDAEKFKTIGQLLEAAQNHPEVYPGVEAAIAMGALELPTTS